MRSSRPAEGVGVENLRMPSLVDSTLCSCSCTNGFAHTTQLGTLLRSKRKLEELQNVLQESRRAAH